VHDKHKNDFHNLFKNYHCPIDQNDLFSITDIEIALSKLKKGKAVGTDGVSVEHLVHAHPCLIMSVKILFNLIMK